MAVPQTIIWQDGVRAGKRDQILVGMAPTLLEPWAGPAVVDELKRDGVLVVERQ